MEKELFPGSITTRHKGPKKTVSLEIALVYCISVRARRHPGLWQRAEPIGAFWWSPEHNGGICGARCPDSGGRGGDGSRDATTEGNFLVKEFLASPKLHLRFYLTAGTFEADTAGGGGEILESTRHLRDVLLAKGYQVHYQQFVGGHDGLSWRGALADGLINLLGGIKGGHGTRGAVQKVARVRTARSAPGSRQKEITRPEWAEEYVVQCARSCRPIAGSDCEGD